MEYVSMVSELNYMSQVVVMLYEDPTKDPFSDERSANSLLLNFSIIWFILFDKIVSIQNILHFMDDNYMFKHFEQKEIFFVVFYLYTLLVSQNLTIRFLKFIW